MIGAGRAERREAGEFLAAHEIQHGVAVVEVADLEDLFPAAFALEITPRIVGMMPAAISRRRSRVSGGVVTAPKVACRGCSVPARWWRDR